MGNACCSKEEFPVFVAYFYGLPRNHAGILVKTETEGDSSSGQLFHVKGNIMNGMTYESRPERDLEKSTTFDRKVRVGYVTAGNYRRMHDILITLDPPSKQFEGRKRIDPNKKLYRCQEWTHDAVKILIERGVLENHMHGEWTNDAVKRLLEQGVSENIEPLA